MTMPTWGQTMYTVMKLLADGEVHTSAEVLAAVIEAHDVTSEEQKKRNESGQTTIYNRTNWGLTYLRKAGFVTNGGKRATNLITDEGRAFLGEHADGFGADEIMAVPAVMAWKSGKGAEEGPDQPPAHEQTPEEAIDAAVRQLDDALADELMERIFQKDPYFFEGLVNKLVVSLGYGALLDSPGTVTSKSGDGGIDGTVRLDRLGFDSIYIQAKRWSPEHKVGKPELQAFVGALVGNGADKGLFITTSTFTAEARDYAEKTLRSNDVKLVLVDGDALTRLMIENGIGVSAKTTYVVKTVDGDFFDETA